MSIIILDPSLLAQLDAIKEQADLCAPDGKVIGRFIPASRAEQADQGGPRITEEELQRRLQAGGGRPLAEIVADLEKRR
jgi:hypothetical protein